MTERSARGGAGPVWVVLVAAGVALYVVLDVVVQLLPPHYSPIVDPESDLGVGPYGWLMDLNFLVRGLLTAAALIAIRQATPRSAMRRTGLIFLGLWGLCSGLLAFFATDVFKFGDPQVHLTGHGTAHLLLAGAGFLCAPVAAILLSRAGVLGARAKTARPLAVLCVVALVAMVVIGRVGDALGLAERIFIGAVLLWTLTVTLTLPRRTAAALSPHPMEAAR